MPQQIQPFDATQGSSIPVSAVESSQETSKESFVPTEDLVKGNQETATNRADGNNINLDEFLSPQPNDKPQPKQDRIPTTKSDVERDNEEDEEDEEVEAVKAEGEELEEDSIKDKDVEKDEKIHGNTKKDFTGLTASQVKICKKLDNVRFSRAATEFRALNEAVNKSVQLAQELETQKKMLTEGGIPNQWYEHPEAYQLSKEFKDLSATYARQDAVEQFYEQQLLNVKAANDFFVIQGWDAQGNPIYSAAQKASNQAEIFLQRELAKASQLKIQLESRSENLSQSFRQQHQQASESVNREVQSYIDRLDKNLKFEEKDVEVLVNALPKMYRDHPLAKQFARMGALNLSQGRYIQKLLGEKTQQVKLEADKKLAGPRTAKISKEPSGAKLGNRNGVLSLDEFLKND